MKREIKFYQGYNCMDFPCNCDKKCTPDNNHGIQGMEIGFYVIEEKGAVQFKLSTNWVPYKSIPSKTGYREVRLKKQCADMFPMPTNLGYHSKTPMYEGHTSCGKCDVLNIDECYYGGSVLNASDAFYVLVNRGEEELWKFLEQYYVYMFENGKYPKVKEYGEK